MNFNYTAQSYRISPKKSTEIATTAHFNNYQLITLKILGAPNVQDFYRIVCHEFERHDRQVEYCKSNKP